MRLSLKTRGITDAAHGDAWRDQFLDARRVQTMFSKGHKHGLFDAGKYARVRKQEFITC